MKIMQTFGGATPLMYACQQCKENQVLDILTKQPHAVKDRDRTLKTPLHYCAENPNTRCAEIVLKFAPDLVNAQDDNGYCTLHLAVIAGNKALIKLLITKGADVNIYDNEGHSAVHWAIVSSEKEALEMIIRAGANPSTPDIHGGYPLHYAVQMCGSTSDYIRNYEDAVRVVETLLNFGVDVNVKDKDGRQPILWAASAGSADAVIHLVSGGACVEAADKDGLTALHCAASRGHTTTLETLITLCGTNVDVIDGNGCSALFYSVTLGHADATEVLLQLGAEPNRQDRKGRTPAHCGAAKGQLETLKILQKRGGNLWLRNVKGDIPLHEAVASGRKDLVLWLLSQNPDAVNIANNDGRCPLHIAAMYNNTEMVKVLLDAKSLVNPVMRTSKGILMTPLNVALCKGHRSCGKYLQLHGGVPFSKVAKIEPASAFAFRVSPSSEITDINIDSLQISKAKAPVSNTSTDIQIVKTEATDKKKVYRRRKKRKNLRTDIHDSDSDENTQNTKTKSTDNWKNGEDDIEDETDEDDENVKKVQSIAKVDIIKEKSSKTVNIKSNDAAVQERVTAKRVNKAKEELKPLPRNKSLKEAKNVNSLSPDDFPPLMQTVNQLDSVIIEPEIEMNKTINEYDVEGGLRPPNPSVGELSGNEQVAEDLEKKEETMPIESKINDEVIDIKGNENEESLGKNEKHEKFKKKSKEDKGEKNPLKESKSPANETPSRKNEKYKTLSKNGGIKKEPQQHEKSGSSNDNNKTKKPSPKDAKIIPIGEKPDKKVEKVETEIQKKEAESRPKEESLVSGSETKEEVNENEEFDKKPDESSDGNKTEEKHGIVPEVESDLTNIDKNVEKIPDLEIKSSDVTTAIAVESAVDVMNNVESGEQAEITESSEPRTVEENLLREEKLNLPDVISTKETENNESKHTAEVSELEFSGEILPTVAPAEVPELPEDGTTTTAAKSLQSHLISGQPSNKESLIVEENAILETLPEEEPTQADSNSPETIEIQPGDENISEETVKASEIPEHEEAEDRRINDGASVSHENVVKELNNDGDQRQHKPVKVSRLCRRHKDLKEDVAQVSVTQLVQNTIKKYHMERGIFYQLLELKRYQIRSGKANEQVLVKRLADEYERSRVFLGMKPYTGLYKFREFEKFLYEQLKALNNRRSFIIPEIKSYDDIDALSGFLKKSRYKIFSEAPQPEMICTCITQRCHHSACAYTSVPCSAYIADIRHHKHHRKKRGCFFPRIDQPEIHKSENRKYTEQPATLELVQGNQKHVITLPQNYPQKNKRYYVTFTIKGVTSPKEEDAMDDSKSLFKHRHAKSV